MDLDEIMNRVAKRADEIAAESTTKKTDGLDLEDLNKKITSALDALFPDSKAAVASALSDVSSRATEQTATSYSASIEKADTAKTAYVVDSKVVSGSVPERVIEPIIDSEYDGSEPCKMLRIISDKLTAAGIPFILTKDMYMGYNLAYFGMTKIPTQSVDINNRSVCQIIQSKDGSMIYDITRFINPSGRDMEPVTVDEVFDTVVAHWISLGGTVNEVVESTQEEEAVEAPVEVTPDTTADVTSCEASVIGEETPSKEETPVSADFFEADTVQITPEVTSELRTTFEAPGAIPAYLEDVSYPAEEGTVADELAALIGDGGDESDDAPAVEETPMFEVSPIAETAPVAEPAPFTPVFDDNGLDLFGGVDGEVEIIFNEHTVATTEETPTVTPDPTLTAPFADEDVLTLDFSEPTPVAAAKIVEDELTLEI